MLSSGDENQVPPDQIPPGFREQEEWEEHQLRVVAGAGGRGGQGGRSSEQRTRTHGLAGRSDDRDGPPSDELAGVFRRVQRVHGGHGRLCVHGSDVCARGKPIGQRGVPLGHCELPSWSTPVGHPPSHHGERPRGQHPFVPPASR